MQELPPANPLLEKLKLKFYNLLARSTFHGLSKIFISEHWPTRLLWLVICLTSYSYCIFSISTNISDYFQNQVITNFEKAYENQPLFPRITICNLNKTSVGCIFNKKASSVEDLNVTGCVLFNSGFNGSILRSKEVGIHSGLVLDLYTNDFFTGIMIYINNHSVRIGQDAITISPGMRTNLAVTRHFETRLSEPYTNCKTHVALANTPSTVSLPYFQSECLIFCKYVDGKL